MKIRHMFILLSILSPVPFSCSVESVDENETALQGREGESKIVNTRSAETISDELLVKVTAGCGGISQDGLSVPGVSSVEKVFRSFPGKEALEEEYGLDRWYVVHIDEGSDLREVASLLSENTDVAAIEYSMPYRKASDCVTYPYFAEPGTRAAAGSLFNDPSLSDQWNYRNNGDPTVATSAYSGADINVYDVWRTLTTGDNTLIVAVIDEGVKYTHPDLSANIWTNPGETSDGADDDGNGYVDDIHGYNFIADGPVTWAAEKDSGHGTHCAGTIAAVNNNSVGVCGVAGGSGDGDGVKIMSCQIFDNNTGGTPTAVARAFKYAADMGASVASCSFGYTGGAYTSDGDYKNGNYGRNTMEYDAIKYFEASKNNDVLDGGIVVFASGNDGKNYSAYPGAVSEFISVSAFGPDFLPAYYTNYGPGCNITAPGGEAYLSPWTSRSMILSTLPSEVNDGSDYGYMQGTSMACPHVSGIVALGLAYARKLGKTFTVQEFKNLILASADDFETRLSSSTKNYASNALQYFTQVPLSNYRKQMGTGVIDAWKLMMNIEGTPCLTAKVGENQWLDLSNYFGTASINLTYTDIEHSTADGEAIGLAEEPYIKYGRLYIHPTKCGSIKLKISAVGGGIEVGDDDAVGGMSFDREVSIIVRSFDSDNGGWL